MWSIGPSGVGKGCGELEAIRADLEQVRVGDVFIAPSFVVPPGDLMARSLAAAADPTEPWCDLPGAVRPGLGCPPEVLIERALASLERSDLGRRGTLCVRSVAARKAGPRAVVGEPLTPILTVRHRALRGCTLQLTLGAFVRRRDGGSACSFEVGLEVEGRARPTQPDAMRRRRAVA